MTNHGCIGYDIETKARSSRFATIGEIKEKSKQELLARFKSVSRIGKNAGVSVYVSEGGYFEGKKLKITVLF